MKKYYISARNLPPRIGLSNILVVWLFLDRIAAPEWLSSIALFILALLSIANIYILYTHKSVDLLKDYE